MTKCYGVDANSETGSRVFALPSEISSNNYPGAWRNGAEMNGCREYETLICGDITIENMYDYHEIMKNLSDKIKKLTYLIMNYNWENGNANVDIPFYCRNVLESSLTAILGRIDPFRLITVYKVQSDPSYDLGKRAQTAVEWAGDIVAKSSSSGNLWQFDKKKESFDRALLGNHMGDAIWKPSFRTLGDYISGNELQSEWLNEFASYSEDENFERLKHEAMRLFSSFSKGVHSECLVDINTMLDDLTLKSLIKDMYKLCSIIALASHFVKFLATKIDIERAISIFLLIEEMVESV